jgi:hypothetical protein
MYLGVDELHVSVENIHIHNLQMVVVVAAADGGDGMAVRQWRR